MPEQGPEITACGSQAWDVRRYRVHGWHDLRRNLQIVFRKRRPNPSQNTTPESRLTQMVVEVGLGVGGNWSTDPMLLERLEARVAASDDLAVHKVFDTYLSEP